MALNPQQLTKQQRAEIEAASQADLEKIANVYALMYDRMGGDIDALNKAIEQLDAPTQAAVKKLPEYKRLERRATQELTRFTTVTEASIEASAVVAISLALAHSSTWINAAGGSDTGLSSRALIPLLDYLRPDGPLYQRLSLLTGSTVDRVTQAIIDGVSLGYNPRKIAAGIEDAFGGGLTDALRNIRTVQIYSYRDAARANYTASGLVDGWIWYAELDGDTCAACIAEHGTFHDNSEGLDGHYNCRCTPVPYIEGLTDDVQTGEDWFNGLDEQTQANILGNTAHAAYKDGAFTLQDMVQNTPNDVYGNMKTVKPLSELIGE